MKCFLVGWRLFSTCLYIECLAKIRLMFHYYDVENKQNILFIIEKKEKTNFKWPATKFLTLNLHIKRQFSKIFITCWSLKVVFQCRGGSLQIITISGVCFFFFFFLFSMLVVNTEFLLCTFSHLVCFILVCSCLPLPQLSISLLAISINA